MKLEELYESILEESISDIVFHSTHMRHFVEILKTNTFTLSAAFSTGAEVEINKNKFFFLSTTRTRTGKYHQGSSGIAFIKLDGRKLRHNYAGAAVDYWGADYRQYDGGAYEQEDRIMSDKNKIPNATKYILGVDFVLDYKPDKRSIRNLAKIIISLKKLNIPVRIFENSRDLVSQSNSISIDDLLQRFDSLDGDSSPNKYHNFRRRPSNSRHHDYVIALYHALKFDTDMKLNNDDRNAITQLVRTIMMNDLGGISADLHNARSNPRYNNLMIDITKMLRKLGFTDWKSATKYIEQKWRPVLWG